MSQALCVIVYLGNVMFKLHISPATFVVNIKFPWASYHTSEFFCLRDSTEEAGGVINVTFHNYQQLTVSKVK